MTRVLIVSGDGWRDRRFAQMVSLYRACGFHVDVILRQTDRGRDRPHQIDRLGALPPGIDAGALIQRMHSDRPVALVHFDRHGGMVETLPGIGVPVIADIDDMFERWGADWLPTLSLSSSESIRRSLSLSGHQALRLPRAFHPKTPSRLPAARRIGWFGLWTEDLMSRWRMLAHRFAEQSICADMTFLLLGPGVRTARLPTGLAVARREGADISALGALDIAVAPMAPDAVRIPEIYTALEHGCPVLTLAGIRAEFEDRWHLPSAESLDELVHLIDQSLTRPGDPRNEILDDPMQQTCAALQMDQQAMEHHFAETLRRMIG